MTPGQPLTLVESATPASPITPLQLLQETEQLASNAIVLRGMIEISAERGSLEADELEAVLSFCLQQEKRLAALADAIRDMRD